MLLEKIKAGLKLQKFFRVLEEKKNKNINEIDKKTKEGEKVLIVGKILSQGEISKRISLVALNYSKKAEEKLLKAKCEFSKISDEIKKNPEAKGLKILE